jgi:hypothetical protein
MTIQIDGLTQRQRIIADVLWAMDSQQAVESFLDSLSEDTQREARSVMHLMIWAMLDTVNETTLAALYLQKYRL